MCGVFVRVYTGLCRGFIQGFDGVLYRAFVRPPYRALLYRVYRGALCKAFLDDAGAAWNLSQEFEGCFSGLMNKAYIKCELICKKTAHLPWIQHFSVNVDDTGLKM